MAGGKHVVLVVMMVLVLVVWVSMVDSIRFSRRRSRRRYHRSTTTTPQQTVQKNTTRYGDTNVCKVCTSTTFNCNYSFYRACPSNSTVKDNKRERDRGNNTRDDKKWNQWTDNDHLKKQNVSIKWRDRRGQKCLYEVGRTCKEKKCEIVCCDGTRKESGTNSCKKRRKSDGTLTGCLNGGTLNSWSTHCTCPEEFIGLQCQHRKCAKVCQNGGQCKTNTTHMFLGDTTYNNDYCICPSETSGEFCEKKKCDKECKNNGTCAIISRWWSHCICQPGFSGQQCERQEKEGECPGWSELASENCYNYYMRKYDCFHDEDCDDKKKCCRNSCHEKICSEPAMSNVTCTYNNQTYGLGSVFYPDPCRVCTCNESHVGLRQGAIECTRLTCPTLSPDCRNVTTPHDACCPMCYDDMSSNMCGEHYENPYFLNCPDNEVILDVEPGSNVAKVNLTLQAKDCADNTLHVRVSDDRFQAGVGEENYHLMSASTELDGRGNFAQCVFHVRVRDNEPPEFLTCPMDFAESADVPASWPIPVARDNVGLKTPPTAIRHPGQSLPPGDYMVEYWAEDYAGNVARCSFVITVLSNGRPVHPHPHPHPPENQHGHSQQHHQVLQPKDSSHNALKVGGAIAGVCLVAVVVIFGYIFYKRYRRMREAAEGGGPTVRMSSVTGRGGAGGGAGGWGGSGGTMSSLPPRYGLSPEEIMSPPVYSRMDGGMMMAAGGAVSEAGELPAKTPLPE